MSAEALAGLPGELADWPAWTPGEAQLADLELLTSGAFAPLRGFMTAADLAAVAERGTLADGTPWPVPVTLEVPVEVVPPGERHLVLQDHEGTPLAALEISEQLPVFSAGGADGMAPGRTGHGAARPRAWSVPEIATPARRGSR